jgi:hypothetical protein
MCEAKTESPKQERTVRTTAAECVAGNGSTPEAKAGGVQILGHQGYTVRLSQKKRITYFVSYTSTSTEARR